MSQMSQTHQPFSRVLPFTLVFLLLFFLREHNSDVYSTFLYSKQPHIFGESLLLPWPENNQLFYFSVMADPLEHATGLEKQEMLAKAAGNDVRISP